MLISEGYWVPGSHEHTFGPIGIPLRSPVNGNIIGLHYSDSMQSLKWETLNFDEWAYKSY